MLFTKEEHSVTLATDKPKCNSIETFLAKKSITIESTALKEPEYNNLALADLAQTIAKAQLKGGNLFLKYIRKAINQKNNSCRFYMGDFSNEEQAACMEIADILSDLGILVGARIENEILKILTGTFCFPSVSFVQFINGRFLEIAIFLKVKSLLEAAEKDIELDFEILPNVKCKSLNGEREYDLLFRIQNQIYMVEVKSGQYRKNVFASYRERGIELDLYPDNVLIVVADNKKEELSNNRHERCYIANYNTFEKNLIKMITK